MSWPCGAVLSVPAQPLLSGLKIQVKNPHFCHVRRPLIFFCKEKIMKTFFSVVRLCACLSPWVWVLRDREHRHILFSNYSFEGWVRKPCCFSGRKSCCFVWQQRIQFFLWSCPLIISLLARRAWKVLQHHSLSICPRDTISCPLTCSYIYIHWSCIWYIRLGTGSDPPLPSEMTYFFMT